MLVVLFKPPEEAFGACGYHGGSSITDALAPIKRIPPPRLMCGWEFRSNKSIADIFCPSQVEGESSHMHLRCLGETLATRLNLSTRVKAKQSHRLKFRASKQKKHGGLMSADAVVFGGGAKGLKSLMSQSTECQPCGTQSWLPVLLSFQCDVRFNAVLWLDRNIPMAYPANVFSAAFESAEGRGRPFSCWITAKRFRGGVMGVMSNRRVR